MDFSLNFQEKVIFGLRDLYRSYGYTQYKMSKFEEYDLYARNKDFLISDSVITFTDRSGKLMALKPDVTLSIVKNTADVAAVQKLFYQENVYRVSKGSDSFRENKMYLFHKLSPLRFFFIVAYFFKKCNKNFTA